MASGRKISPPKWAFARRRLYENTSVRISIADGFGPISGSVKPFSRWQPPGKDSLQPSTGQTAKQVGTPSRRGRPGRRRFPILLSHATRRRHEDPAQTPTVDRLPVRSALSGAGRRPAIRENISGAGGTVQGARGAGPPRLVHRTHV